MLSKPAIRWTISGQYKTNLQCLIVSINNIKHLYKDRFDLFVFYNNVPRFFLTTLVSMGVTLVDQSKYLDNGRIPNPSGLCKVSWKLFGPRNNPNAHEIWLDNDLIVYKSMPHIEEFLAQDDQWMMTEGLRRGFGVFDHLVKTDKPLNSGFVGIPPGKNLIEQIEGVFEETGFKNWVNYFDEQGLVAIIVTRNKYKVVSLEDINICLDNFDKGKYGQHLVGLNSPDKNNGKNIVDYFLKEYTKIKL